MYRLLSFKTSVNNNSEGNDRHRYDLQYRGYMVQPQHIFMILSNLLQALDHSDFDWGDPEKFMEKSANLNVRILKTYPKIRSNDIFKKRFSSVY